MSSEYSVQITHDGVTYDYTKCVCVMQNYPTKTQYISSIATLDFDLAGMDLFNLPVPGRGDYIQFNTAAYGEWFTGYIINNPKPVILGQDQTSTKRWVYSYQVNSDDYILNLQSMPINKVYINTTAGGIIRDLAATLMPGVFDTANVQDGPLIGKYVLDPTKKFSDVVNDLAGNAYYRFYGQAKSLYFYPIDQAPKNFTIDGNSKYFTPSGFTQLEASTNPVVNDCTVLGLVEPQGKITDYFVGDGFTGKFQLTTGVYGLAEEVLLNEQFTNGTIDGNTWTVHDTAETFLQVSQGYLNCLGGSNNGSFDVYIQANDPIPLEGTIRLTHGQYDFVQQSNGVVGALYTDLPTAPNAGVFENCLYGLRVAPGSNSSTTIYPLVNGVVDTTQSLNINNYTMYNFRYTARTIITYDLPNRTPQQYSYFGPDGAVGSTGLEAQSCNVTFQTFIAVVDPNTGAIEQTVTFTNTTTVPASTLYAFYTPFVSNNLNATVTGITVSQPLQASLELKSLQHPTYTVTSPGGDVQNSPDQSHFLGQTMTAGSDWEISCDIISISKYNTGQQKAGLMVRRASDTTGTDVFCALIVRADGVASLRYRSAANATVTEVGQLNQNNGVVDGLTLPQYFKLVKSGSTFTAYYSSDGSDYTEYATTTVTIDSAGDTILGVFVSGETYNTPEQITAEFQLVEINGVEIAVDTERDLGYPSGAGFDSGFSTNTKNWTPQIIGVNELDTLDGLAPIAAIVQQTNSVQKNKNDRGSYEYNPGQCTLEYFSDTTTQTTNVPQQGDLIACRYSRSGTALARIADNAGVLSESEAWNDSGHRATLISNLTPAPRTSDECAAAATAEINSSGWKHYSGTYNQVVTSTNGYGFTGEPVAGAVLPFVNMGDAAPGIVQEIIQQVQTTLVSTAPNEVYSHQINFGPINTAQEFLSRLRQPQGVVVPQDTAYIPNAVDLLAYNQAVLPQLTDVQYDHADAGNFHFVINDLLSAGENVEIRYSDDSWGCDVGKNLVARILNGQPQTFTTPRTPNGRIAFARRYDTRNLLTYSEDLTKWTATTGVSVANSKQIDPNGALAQVSTVTVTQAGKLYLTFPVTAASGAPTAAMLYMRGPTGAQVTVGGYGDATNWNLVACGGTSALKSGWNLVRVSGNTTQALTTITFAVEFAQTGTYKITHAQFELNSVSTVYCRTNGSPYGALSRYSAGVRAQLPMIPPAPTGSVDTTDPVNPVITLVLPAVLTDVWGFEIRDTDNKTVLNRAQYGQTGFGQGFDMTYTVAENTEKLRFFYLYTFNLLNEYSAPYEIGFDLSYLVAPPSNVVAEDDSSTVSVSSDGTTSPRLMVKWTPTTDPFVLNGGSYDVRYQLSTTTTAAQPSALLDPVQQSDGSWVSSWVDVSAGAGGSSSSSGGAVNLALLGWDVFSGAPATNVGNILSASRATTISQCALTVTASDTTTDLTFDIQQAGVSIFTTLPTITHGATPGQKFTLALKSASVPVAQFDNFNLNITVGTSSWKFAVYVR